MMRRCIAVLISLLFLPVIALADTQVIDDAQLFTNTEVSKMEEIISRIENKHQVDMVVLSTEDTPLDYSTDMRRVREYADNFYDNGGYGMGEDKSGMLILLDMNNRTVWLSTGGVMFEYINDSREEDILDRAFVYLPRGDYGDAIIAALSRVEYYMNKGRAEGTFLYDEVTGERLSGIYNALTSSELLLAAGAGGAAALVLFLCVSGSYNLKGSTYTYDQAANTSITLTRDEECYVRQFVNRVPRSTGSHGPRSGGGRSGGSGVHRSSGGIRHGGGGRRF